MMSARPDLVVNLVDKCKYMVSKKGVHLIFVKATTEATDVFLDDGDYLYNSFKYGDDEAVNPALREKVMEICQSGGLYTATAEIRVYFILTPDLNKIQKVKVMTKYTKVVPRGNKNTF
jgi:hypothetical protein